MFVLQGIDWSKVKPEIIICEYEDNKTLQLGYNFNDLITFLQNKNYLFVDGRYTLQAKIQSGANFKVITIPSKYPSDLFKGKKYLIGYLLHL